MGCSVWGRRYVHLVRVDIEEAHWQASPVYNWDLRVQGKVHSREATCVAPAAQVDVEEAHRQAAESMLAADSIETSWRNTSTACVLVFCRG